MDDIQQTITLNDAKRCVGKGWHLLLDILYSSMPKETEVLQVKEKWAGLRFYVGSTTPEFLNIISLIEHLSLCICEDCGNIGEEKICNGWYRTLCQDCFEKGNHNA